MSQKHNAELVRNLTPWFGLRNEMYVSSAINQMRLIPQLRSLWPISSIDETGAVYDTSAQGRTLTNNNSVGFGADGFVPYATFASASSRFLSRADEAGTSITGSLTIGGWFYHTVSGAFEGQIGKYGTAGNRSYLLAKQGTDKVALFISNDGTNTKIVSSTATLSLNTWYFVVGRYTPSSEIAISLNTAQDTNTSSIYASLFDSTSPVRVGSSVGTSQFMDGRAAFCFLAAAALTDVVIGTIYEAPLPLFS
jgi:hypothetical protein